VDELPEVYSIASLDQMRAIADDLRIRIFDRLTRQPMTVTQLGEALGVAPAKAHYHVRELERVGLVKLVETREKGGILEKYYRAVARDITVSPGLLRGLSPDDMAGAVSQFLDVAARGFLRAVAHEVRKARDRPDDIPAQSPLGLSGASLWMTDEEARQLALTMADAARPYIAPRGIAGERERMLIQLLYPIVPETGEDDTLADTPEPGVAAPGDTPTDALDVALEATSYTPGHRIFYSRAHRIITVGAVSFSRDDLRRAVERGQPLDIQVYGACAFARDIPPELADRAIARFRHRGRLDASPEVKEVLARKS
jgi:DNA-binding transcriptional ArsR family regulator